MDTRSAENCKDLKQPGTYTFNVLRPGDSIWPCGTCRTSSSLVHIMAGHLYVTKLYCLDPRWHIINKNFMLECKYIRRGIVCVHIKTKLMHKSLNFVFGIYIFYASAPVRGIQIFVMGLTFNQCHGFLAQALEVISSHTFMGMWLLIHAGIKVKPC